MLVFNTLPGLFIGIAVSLVLLLYRASRPNVAVLGRLPSGEWVDTARSDAAEAEPGDAPRAAAVAGIFGAALLSVPWLGLAPALGVAGGLVTLLFSGPHRPVRAVATAVGLWLIAFLLFGKLLGLPLP